MNQLKHSTLFVLFICLTSCEEAVDKCKFIEITKNSDFENYEDCTFADEVAIYGETTHVDGLNNLIEVKTGIHFTDPDLEDDGQDGIDAPIKSITGFKKLMKLGFFDFSTEDDIYLQEFDSLHEVTEISSFVLGANSNILLSHLGPINVKEIKAFEKLEEAPDGIIISGQNIEIIPDFNNINNPDEIILGLPNIKKIPTFNSLKSIYNNISVNFCGNFSESEIEAEFSGIKSERRGNNYLKIYDQCE